MSSRILVTFILAFSLGALAGNVATNAVLESQASARADDLPDEVQQLRAINKAQAEELRRLKDERGE
jgi:hypothetical protein